MKLVWILSIWLSTLVAAAGPGAQSFEQAQAAERAGDTVQAFLLYNRATSLEPNNAIYRARRDALRKSTASTARELWGGVPVERQDDGRWAAITGSVGGRDLIEAQVALPPPKLEALPGKRDFDLSGVPLELFEKVCAAFGLEAIFEKEYQPPPPIRFRVTGMDYMEALRSLELATNSFVTPISEKKLLVARDTAQKRQELQSTVAMAIPIPHRMSVQDAQELVTLVQQVFDIRRITVDPQRKLIFIRDAVSKAVAAKRMMEDLALYRPHVSVEVEMLSVSKSSSLSAGVNLQNAAPLIDFGRTAFATFAAAPDGFTNFLAFGGGKTFFGIGVTAASLFASGTDASSNSILKSHLTAIDGLPTSLHVGDKYPVATNAYIGNTSGGGQVFTPPPTFNFEDLGVVLKVTPTVHGAGDVTLDIESEFKVLGNGTLNGIPIISARKYTGKVRLKTGECAVVAGLLKLSDSKDINGIPGLAKVPFLRQNSTSHDRTETLLVLTPRILSLPPGEFVTRTIWLGTETKPLSTF